MHDILKRSLLTCPIVKKGEYNYFVHPITDGVPKIDPDLLNEVCEAIIQLADTDVDMIVTAEAMGIPMGAVLSLQLGIPLNIIRKRSYGLQGEVEIQQETGYSKNRMFINGLEKGNKILFVDDVVSTGGTLRASIKTLKEMGVVIVDIIIAINKSQNIKSLEEEIGHEIKYLVHVDVVDGKVVIMD